MEIQFKILTGSMDDITGTKISYEEIKSKTSATSEVYEVQNVLKFFD